MKYLVQILCAVIIAAAIGGVGFFGVTTYQKLKSQEISNEARYQCALSSRYETTDKTATVTYPVKDLYEKCLKEKGL